MKYVDVSFQGRKTNTQGWMIRLGVFFVGIACLLSPVTAQAGTAITQGEFLMWLAAATGEADDMVAPSPNDLVLWAQSKGLNPNGGWNPSAVLTTDVLAQTLVQLFGLNPKKYGGDFIKNLLREGIVLPETADLTRELLVDVVDQFGMQGKLKSVSKSRGSGVNGDNGHPGNLVPPGFRNPRNPHYGQITPDDDPRPGHVGLGPRNEGGNSRNSR